MNDVDTVRHALHTAWSDEVPAEEADVSAAFERMVLVVEAARDVAEHPCTMVDGDSCEIYALTAAIADLGGHKQ